MRKTDFFSLRLILEKLSGNVGRRQYRMMCDITRHFERLKEEGIDWHELKWLNRTELMDLFDNILLSRARNELFFFLPLRRRFVGYFVVPIRDTPHRYVSTKAWRSMDGVADSMAIQMMFTLRERRRQILLCCKYIIVLPFVVLSGLVYVLR
ncbi:hypothetical protein C4B63_354g2 [Trypanosoma cruzi]|uniref:Uncharacterized protein n=1 Tax=Trypanosoma cruzi TaxID=5693 RepID=A0A2V2UG78_TRYCR|nr:hypothetical protein C4B63_354g2 [Trypanosoma cruzi]